MNLAARSALRRVASGILPDVEGGVPPPGICVSDRSGTGKKLHDPPWGSPPTPRRAGGLGSTAGETPASTLFTNRASPPQNRQSIIVNDQSSIAGLTISD